MPVKYASIPGVGQVKLVKRRGARSIRLSIDSRNCLRISLPPWVSYQTALGFAASRKNWIESHWEKTEPLKDKEHIGKAHILCFIPKEQISRPSSRLLGNEVRILYPNHLSSSDTSVQSAAQRGAIRALTNQAETLLPRRLLELSKKHGFQFHSVQIKKIHSRWGSCSTNQEITLNIFLMQLPWELIDYVIMHELVHTEILHHQAAFWRRLEQCLPKTKQYKKALRNYKPSLSSYAYGIMDV